MREDQGVSYLGGHSRYGNPLWGRLVLTNKRFAFIEQRVVELGTIMKRRQVETVGLRINLPIDRVLGAQSEARVRKTGIFSEERYNVLIVSIDSEHGVENPVFQVADPQGWTSAIQKAMGGEVVTTGTGARTCRYCGQALAASGGFCPNCGKSQG